MVKGEMDFSELAELININSYTKNKQGVDKSGALFQLWMEEIGFCLLYTSPSPRD